MRDKQTQQAECERVIFALSFFCHFEHWRLTFTNNSTHTRPLKPGLSLCFADFITLLLSVFFLFLLLFYLYSWFNDAAYLESREAAVFVY